MSERKVGKKTGKKDALKSECKYVPFEIFEQFKESILREIDQFKEIVQELENKIAEKDLEISKLKEEKETENKRRNLKLIDNLEREIKINDGGYILA